MNLHLASHSPYRADGVSLPDQPVVQLVKITLFASRTSHVPEALHRHTPENPTPEATHRPASAGAAFPDLCCATADLSGALKISQRLERHRSTLGPTEVVERGRRGRRRSGAGVMFGRGRRTDRERDR
jgi:hypothetical protein